MRSCPDHTYKLTYHCPSGSPPLATLACVRPFVLALPGCFPWGLHKDDFFSSFGFNVVTIFKKPFLHTSSSPASCTPFILFYFIYSTYCHRKLSFYLSVYSFMISLPTLEHKRHEGRIWASISCSPRVQDSAWLYRRNNRSSEKLSNWPEVTSLYISSRIKI